MPTAMCSGPSRGTPNSAASKQRDLLAALEVAERRGVAAALVEQRRVVDDVLIRLPELLRRLVIHPAAAERNHLIGIEAHRQDVLPLGHLHDLADGRGRRHLGANQGRKGRGGGRRHAADDSNLRGGRSVQPAHGHPAAGPQDRPARLAAEPRVHRRRPRHPGAGHRRDVGHLQRGPRRAAGPAAVCRTGPPRADLEPLGGLRQDLAVESGGHRLPDPEPDAVRGGGLGHRPAEPDRRRRPRPRRGRRRSPRIRSRCSARRPCSAGPSGPRKTSRMARQWSCSAIGSGRRATAAMPASSDARCCSTMCRSKWWA